MSCEIHQKPSLAAIRQSDFRRLISIVCEFSEARRRLCSVSREAGGRRYRGAATGSAARAARGAAAPGAAAAAKMASTNAVIDPGVGHAGPAWDRTAAARTMSAQRHRGHHPANAAGQAAPAGALLRTLPEAPAVGGAAKRRKEGAVGRIPPTQCPENEELLPDTNPTRNHCRGPSPK